MALISKKLPTHKAKFLQLHFGSKKISEYNAEDFKQLYAFILNVCKLIGVTEAPDTPIVLLLIEHLKEFHFDFSKQEIERAFSLATADKLDMEFKHWNRITPQLVSSVLNKYKVFRSKEIVAHQKEQEERELEEKAKARKITPEQRLENNIKDTIELFEAYRLHMKKNPQKLFVDKNKQPVIPNPSYVNIELRDWGSVVYSFLDSCKCLSFSNEEKKDMMKSAKQLLLNERAKESKAQSVGAVLENHVFKHDDSILIRKSKQIALESYFNEVIKLKLDIKQEIDNALHAGNT